MEGVASLYDLPDELLDQIFGLSGIIGITSISCVCRRFARVSDSTSVWRTVSVVERLVPHESTKIEVLKRCVTYWYACNVVLYFLEPDSSR
jgi:hypothetical protein